MAPAVLVEAGVNTRSIHRLRYRIADRATAYATIEVAHFGDFVF